ncbi:hypothetical protein GWA97_13195 [Flavobacterium sp. LaA7.5]|nr:hypothetical protein [Flavobacterium salilacus subsp. altitudinum]
MNKTANLFTIIGGVFTVIGVVITIIFFTWQQPKETKSIDGEWQMYSYVEFARMNKYIGAKVKWKLYLIQSGSQIKGIGEKIAINNEDIDFSSRTKISIDGSVKDNTFLLNFTEKGKLRETCGKFKGTINDDKFEGTFSQTASDAKGKISGIKID